MLSVNPDLTSAEISALLKSTARPFPNTVVSEDLRTSESFGTTRESNSSCTTATCGSGIVDAAAAVNAALVFDPLQPGPLAAAIQDDQPILSTGGGGSGGLGSLNLGMLLLMGWLAWLPRIRSRRQMLTT